LSTIAPTGRRRSGTFDEDKAVAVRVAQREHRRRPFPHR
jgi:hypothetical protein